MSQINDALRRASHTAKGNNSQPSWVTPPPLPPEPEAEESAGGQMPSPGEMELPPFIPQEPPPAKSSKAPLIIILLLLACGAGGGGFYFWRKTHGFSGRFAAGMEKKLSLMEANMARGKPSTFSNPILRASNVFASTAALTASATNASGAAPSAAPAVQPKPPLAPVTVSTPAKFPPLRLQSIFYRPSNPCVMINGKLLCISDEIQGVLVADIQPSSVTLVLSGYTNVLTLR